MKRSAGRTAPMRAVLLGLAGCLAVACSGSSIPSSVQQGGTIVLPLVTNSNLSSLYGDNVFLPAYGSATANDEQHGEMTIWLLKDGAWVGTLDTRAVLPVAIPPEAPLGEVQSNWGRQLLLIADVPDDAPLGESEMFLFRFDGVLHNASLQGAYSTLSILPKTTDPFTDWDGQSITVTSSGAETLMQTPTGTADWGGGAVIAIPGHTFGAEGYSFGIRVLDPAQQNPLRATSSEITVDYPDSIQVMNVVPLYPTYVHAWFEDVPPAGGNPGTLTIRGVAREHPLITSMAYRVTFTLAGASPLDLAQLDAQVVSVNDQQGEPYDETGFDAVTTW